MKQFFPAACLSIFLLMTVQESVMAASVQENPTASAREKKTTPAKKTAAAQSKQAVVKKRPPVASKSKSASEIAKTPLPAAKLDLSLPKDMVEELDPIGTVPLPRHDELLPQMFGDKAGSSPFQLNGRLLNNEMQLQLRNEERRDVEGAALDFEFKQ
ncbi:MULTISPECIES: translation initiation factor 2 [unclassified Pseudomonas]|uniref:translation initiation factor 2 n=1 Tax=unclassified Pseudomonas TaxID=196821 RepID=UPI0013914AB5|nr:MULTISPECIES: translation initiation factor 2 [unclassified Pseudomonas]KAI2693359.1 translation initiation factor 2 [Pseudomonas sp. TNT3]MBF4559177.1 translation initiation factor 2 [Pseudomonas sp. p50(2008)]MBH2036974.1 translation initiation factor 2 [Pseudomonadales bacterium]MBH2079256.1 translation initiation factor 2 [Pseudomonadales bacterium]